MNNEFLTDAFKSAEQKRIVSVTLENPENPLNGRFGGNSTEDKIFSLSYVDIQNYFSSDADRIAYPTAYSGLWYQYEKAPEYWWLRTPGYLGNHSACVNRGGSFYPDGIYNLSDKVAVRPALWLTL